MGIYARLSSSDVNTDLIYFGSKAGSNNRYWIGNKDSQIYYGWNTNTYRQTNIVANTTNIIVMNYLNSRKSMFNDEIIKDIGNTGLNSNNHSIYIFGGNDSGSASYKSSIKLYEFKISDGDTLTHEFIPCYRKSDGEIGLYDKVENKFYTNAGTGTFIKGNDV